nr:bifunctional 4-hydroxy-2-oxoglutarate aldolase/2-dehydro-3-deoxy-phosphogluconate aldolase [Propionicimonas sp.]
MSAPEPAVERKGCVPDLLETAVVVVVRTANAAGMNALAEALIRGGVRHMEITTTVPAALDCIASVQAEAGDRIHVGAGTVLDVRTAKDAIRAGARFIVSPVIDPAIVDAAKTQGVPVIPGCMTPTEILAALRLEVDCIKLFPGRVATPGFFADMLGPFPNARLMPTGNVDLATMPQYLRAGAVAVGVGKAIVDPAAFAHGEWDLIAARATDFVELARRTKGRRQ